MFHRGEHSRSKKMKKNKILVNLFVFLGLIISKTNGASYTEVSNLLTTLTTNYNKNVRPLTDQNNVVHVENYMYLKSITSLDEVNGVLTTVVSLVFVWSDEKLVWDPANHGWEYAVKLPVDSVWIPYFITSNPASKLDNLGHKTLTANIQHDGTVHYEIGERLQTTCDVDVTYFPFDVQSCEIELVPWSFGNNEVNLTAGPIRLTYFSENNVWIVKSSRYEITSFGTAPYIKYTINLERRYSFFILNLFSPVLLLAFLNTMVFLLPADSGERVGYAVTCLLSLSVYMTFASESLPISSKPISIIIYILLVYMIISAFMCVETIIGLKFHLHDDSTQPPRFLYRFYCKSFVRCRCKKKVAAQTLNNNTEELPEKDPAIIQETVFTWKMFARLFDRFCFVLNIFCIFLVSIIYIGIVRNRQ